MGIYDKGKMPKFNPREFLFPVFVAVIVILILSGIWFIGSLFEPRVMAPSFYKSPWVLLDSNSNVLVVKVTNTEKLDAKDVLVSAISIDPKSISVYPQSQTIGVIGAGENRIMNFVLTPDPKTIKSGTYSFEVSVKMNSKASVMRASVEVQS